MAFSSVLAGCLVSPLTVSVANAAEQVNAPCVKLTVQEVKYPSSGAARVVFVTSIERNQNAVLITGCVQSGAEYKQEWQTTGFIGKNGFAAPGELREGAAQSPTGSFTATEALGKSNPGTKLEYHTINPASRWGGPGSPSYNSYTENGLFTDENLWYWMNEGTYEQAAVINYNRPPDTPAAIPGADYAIFFGAGNRVSAGCVSTDLATSTRVVASLVPGDRFIMGAVDDVFLPTKPVQPIPTLTTTATPSPLPTQQEQHPSASQPVDTSRTSNLTYGIPLAVLGFALIATAVIWRRKTGGDGSEK